MLSFTSTSIDAMQIGVGGIDWRGVSVFSGFGKVGLTNNPCLFFRDAYLLCYRAVFSVRRVLGIRAKSRLCRLAMIPGVEISNVSRLTD